LTETSVVLTQNQVATLLRRELGVSFRRSNSSRTKRASATPLHPACWPDPWVLSGAKGTWVFGGARPRRTAPARKLIGTLTIRRRGSVPSPEPDGSLGGPWSAGREQCRFHERAGAGSAFCPEWSAHWTGHRFSRRARRATRTTNTSQGSRTLHTRLCSLHYRMCSRPHGSWNALGVERHSCHGAWNPSHRMTEVDPQAG
jgi:hypothetical protein